MHYAYKVSPDFQNPRFFFREIFSVNIFFRKIPQIFFPPPNIFSKFLWIKKYSTAEKTLKQKKKKITIFFFNREIQLLGQASISLRVGSVYHAYKVLSDSVR